MEHITVGKIYYAGKTVPVECIKNPVLNRIDIKDKCFLLIVLLDGSMHFSVNGEDISASAYLTTALQEMNATAITEA